MSEPEAPQPIAAKTLRSPKCSVCGRTQVPDYAPFCSQRCKDVDLSRWLTGAYAIAGSDEDGDSEDEAAS